MKNVPDLATKDPDAFFKLLEERLLEFVEEQSMKQKRVGVQFRNRRAPPSSNPIVSMKNEEEDLDQMLESHLNRVIESPGGRHSPVMKNRRHPQVSTSFRGTNISTNHSGIGVVPGMAQNEVPDVPTGVRTILFLIAAVRIFNVLLFAVSTTILRSRHTSVPQIVLSKSYVSIVMF